MDPAQDQDKQSQTTGNPPPNPVTPPIDPITPPTNSPASPSQGGPFPPVTVDDTPSADISPEIPDPTSPPPPGADTPQETSFVPPMITPPAPSRSKAKIVGALLAILILVVSIPA